MKMQPIYMKSGMVGRMNKLIKYIYLCHQNINEMKALGFWKRTLKVLKRKSKYHKK